MARSKLGNKKKALQKNLSIARKIACHRFKYFGFFLKGFSIFAKGIYETCNLNFFNLAFIVVAFSIAQSILFLRFASNN